MQTQYALNTHDMNVNWTAALAGSFPASDPPPWTFGAHSWTDLDDSVFAAARPAAVDVVIREGYRLGGIRLASLGEAIAMVAMVPFAILIAGVPVVALIWGIHECSRMADREPLIHADLFSLEWRCRPM